MISFAEKLQELISPEILIEIRDSFVQKYGVGICVYDVHAIPLINYSNELPSLTHLDDEQKELFHVFYHIEGIEAGLSSDSQEPVVQQFADGLVLRSILPISMDRNLLGFACLLDVRRYIDPVQDKEFIDALKDVKNKLFGIDKLQDQSQSVVSSDYLLWNKELRDVIHLFLEAGKARAQIDDHDDAMEEPAVESSLETKTGILFCTSNGGIIEALPDAAELLGYGAPGDLCDLNFLDDLIAEESEKKRLRMIIQERNSEPTSVVLYRKDRMRVNVTLQFIPQQNDGAVLGFECHMIARETPFPEDIGEYEKDQTAIGLIAEHLHDKDEFELSDNIENLEQIKPPHFRKKKRHVDQGFSARSRSGSPFKPPIGILANLLDASASPIIVVDADDRIQLWNRAMGDFLNIPAKSALGTEITHLLVTNFHATWKRWKDKLLKSPEGSALKPKILLPLIRKDASVVMSNVRISKVNLFADDYLVIALTTDEKKNEPEKEEEPKPEPRFVDGDLQYDALADLQRHYKNVRSQFSKIAEILADNVSKIYLESLRNDDSKKRYAAIKRIADISAYIDRNLAYFTGEKEPTFAPTDVNYIVGEINIRLQQFLPVNVELKANFEKSLKKVYADQDMLVHALGAICKNAIDAMPGGGALTIETAMDESGDNVVIAINDTGIGFSNNVKKRLFEPFFSTKRSGMGKGLGLAAVYGIIHAHHGALTVENKPGEGTMVKVVLPAVADNEEKQKPREEEPSRHRGFVLVIDDEMDIAEATAMTLTREGYFVITSTSCNDGVAMFSMYRDEIDVIVIDNRLGEASGLECARQILNIDADAQFVFYSGADDDFELTRFIQKSGAGWLRKPFKTKELIAQIEKQLVAKKMQ